MSVVDRNGCYKFDRDPFAEIDLTLPDVAVETIRELLEWHANSNYDTAREAWEALQWLKAALWEEHD